MSRWECVHIKWLTTLTGDSIKWLLLKIYANVVVLEKKVKKLKNYLFILNSMKAFSP